MLNGYHWLLSKPVISEPRFKWAVDITLSLIVLGNLYRNQDQQEKAESSYRGALKLWEEHWPMHPRTALSLSFLGRLYRDQKRYEDARLLFERAMYITEHTWGPESKDFAGTLEDYAVTLRELKRDEEAATYENRARIIRTKHD